MGIRQALVGAVVLFWTAGAALAHGLPDRSAEAYRSPDGQARSVSVNPNDGSCWAANGNRVVHYAASGAVISRTDLWVPISVSVNPTDGSCWVGDVGFTPDAPDDRMVVHLGADGGVLTVVGGFQYPMSVAVDPRDGSCWVADGIEVGWGTWGTGSLVHLSPEGAELWRGLEGKTPHMVQVNATDGSCWALAAGTLYHLSASGQELFHRTYEDATSLTVNSADGSCWVSSVHDAGTPVGLARLAADGTELWQGEFADAESQTAPLAVDTSDGSCWVGMSPTTWHVAADGTQLPAIDMGGGSPLLSVPASLSVYPSDGSLWEASSGVLLHFASTGATLWQNVPRYYYYNPPAAALDGSCWIYDEGRDKLLHIAPDGAVLREITFTSGGGIWWVNISPNDGSVWLRTPSGLFRYTCEGDALQHINPLLDGQDAALVDMAIDASDGSYWLSAVSSEAAVARYSADGEQLARSAALTDPRGVAVDPTDHSCWAADGAAGQLVHIAADGSEVDRVRISPGGGASVSPEVVALDSRHGLCYVTYGSGLARVGADSLHVSYFSLPAEALSVDPDTGACWVGGGNAVTLLAPDGTVLWREEGFSSFRGIWGSLDLRTALPVSSEPARHGCWVLDWGNKQLVRIEIHQPPYSDIPYDFWAREAIYLCSVNGIVFGYEGGQYRPEAPVTRDQMAVYISRALAGGDEAVPDYAGAADFTDVPLDHWAAKYIYYVKGQNVVTGYPDGSYQPSKVVTRDQMAVYISRAVANPIGEEGLAGYEPPDTASFTDVPTDFWAYRYVEYARSRDIVNGYSDGTYRPEAAVTRDQMAVYVARAFALE
jgi:DNA-binding beta-propeller fold protein YncE